MLPTGEGARVYKAGWRQVLGEKLKQYKLSAESIADRKIIFSIFFSKNKWCSKKPIKYEKHLRNKQFRPKKVGPSIETRTGSKKTQMPLITTDLTHREGHRKNHDTLPMFFWENDENHGWCIMFFLWPSRWVKSVVIKGNWVLFRPNSRLYQLSHFPGINRLFLRGFTLYIIF